MQWVVSRATKLPELLFPVVQGAAATSYWLVRDQQYNDNYGIKTLRY